MLTSALFFVFTFFTFAALLWAGIELFRNQEDPLGDRMDELQAHAMVSADREPRRRASGGFFGGIIYIISLIPGGQDWVRDSRRELNQAGIRGEKAVALYAMLNVAFMVALLGGMFWLQRNNSG